MTQLWRLQLMENLYKEPLWRLAVNGVAAAGGHGISMAGPRALALVDGPALMLTTPLPSCAGSATTPGTASWHRLLLPRFPLPSPPAAPPLTHPQIWLLQSPSGVDAAMWPVIMALALFLMNAFASPGPSALGPQRVPAPSLPHAPRDGI